MRAHAPIGDATTHFLGSLYHFAAMDGVTAAHLKETIVKTSEVRQTARPLPEACAPVRASRRSIVVVS